VAQIGIKELLEAGVHFGHQTRRWNPKMRRFIFGERDGIYIIDLVQTEQLLANAREFAETIARRGGTVMFVGTKKQARDAIQEVAETAGMPYVNHRWLGGLLTNFQTISLRIKRLHDLERYETEGQLELLPTRERMAAQADLEKLRANLGGVKNMQRTPDALFVIDLKTEAIAVKEAQRLRIPIIGLVDTNCDPEGIDYVIPGNDDAIRSCAAITRAIGDVVASAHNVYRAEEERARLERERQEAEERARQEAQERARQEAQERARQEAEERARQEAEERARQETTEQPRQQDGERARRETDQQARQQTAAPTGRDAQPASATQPAPPAQAEPAPAVEAEAAPDAESGSVVEAEAAPDAESGSVAEAEAAPDAEPGSVVEAEAAPDAESGSVAEAEAAPDAEPGSVAEADAAPTERSEPASTVETEPSSATNSEPAPAKEQEPAPVTEPEPTASSEEPPAQAAKGEDS
jgi:small subunit ribosomal protein S2